MVCMDELDYSGGSIYSDLPEDLSADVTMCRLQLWIRHTSAVAIVILCTACTRVVSVGAAAAPIGIWDQPQWPYNTTDGSRGSARRLITYANSAQLLTNLVLRWNVNVGASTVDFR
jgi:hypothetical protein